MSCVDFKKIQLKPYQKLPVYFIERPLNRGILLLFNVGFGKTITSIAMLNCLLTKSPDKKAIVLTPSSLVSNYQNELNKVLPEFAPGVLSRITIESYGKFINKIKKEDLKADSNTIIVLDEAQYLIGKGSKRFDTIFNFSKKANKVIILSATPIRNDPTEITNLLSLINGFKIPRKLIEETLISSGNNEEVFKNLYKLFRCKIMVHGFGDKGVDYAKRTDHDIYLKMQNDFYYSYYNIQKSILSGIADIYKNNKDLTHFLNGIRRGVNKANDNVLSPKISWVIEKIKENINQRKKILVYSNWLDSGINIIKEILDKMNIRYSTVTGELSRKEKDLNIKNYNTNKTNIMLISSSGSEGLSLKNTRTVVILEKAWNNSKLEQVIGRAIRLGSHFELPEKDRTVDVYNLILVKPILAKTINFDFVPTADEILMKLSGVKDKKIDKFYDHIKRMSISVDKSCL